MVGAGAAGLSAAYWAAAAGAQVRHRRRRLPPVLCLIWACCLLLCFFCQHPVGSPAAAQVAVLEKTAEAGKKILISGGTRCNVLPAGPIDLQRDFVTESSASALRAVFRCAGRGPVWLRRVPA